MNAQFQNSESMMLPIESGFNTSPIVNFATIATTAVSEDGEKTFLSFNLTSDELCLQLRGNLTDEFPICPPCCEHAPQLTDKVIIKVIVLSLMGIFSLVGNVATIWNIRKNRATRRALRHSCSAIYALLLHLSVADILVTFFCIIGEALWSYTVKWLAGDIGCKLVKIFQMFSLYLSTNVLVLIGIDRWVAVKYPMKSKFLNTARFVVSL
jgi:7 transmembrane receptor (rhodopsin family)